MAFSEIFSLYGKLDADTKAFVAALNHADNRLKATEKLFLETEKIKQRAAAQSALMQEKFAGQAAAAAEREQHRIAAAARRAAEAAKVSWTDTFTSLGSGMQRAGTAMSALVTAPLVGIGAAAIKSAVGFDTLRTQLSAATGDTESANAKFDELRKLSQENAGVMTKGAVATYAFLKPLGLTDGVINEVIKSFGRLKAVNPEVDLQRMATNLAQLFDQGFEMQDVKELFGNFPRAGEILQKAFGLSGSDRSTIAEEMKAAMAAGLTKQDFFAKFAEGINTDQFLSRVTDPIAVRFEKMAERIMLALEPVGLVILSVFERIGPPIASFIQMLSTAFMSLSPTMQMVVVAFLGLAAAAGPVLYMLGGMVTTIAGLVTTGPVIGIIAAAIAGIGIALVPVIAIATLFYQAWANNWGLVLTVFEAGKARVEAILAALSAFWTAHGDTITGYAVAAYEAVMGVITQVMDMASSYVQLGLQVIMGDWDGAWQTILMLVQQYTAFIYGLFVNWMSLLKTVFGYLGPILKEAFLQALTVGVRFAVNFLYILATLPAQIIKLIPSFVAAGADIANAFWRGLKQVFTGGLSGSAGGIAAPDGGIFQQILDQFKGSSAGMGGDLGAAFTAPAGPTATFLSPLKKDAIQTSDALDKLKQKIDTVKRSAVTPVPAKPLTNLRELESDAWRVANTRLNAGRSPEFMTAELQGIADAAKRGERAEAFITVHLIDDSNGKGKMQVRPNAATSAAYYGSQNN